MALVPSRLGLGLLARLQSVEITARALVPSPSPLSPSLSPFGSREVAVLNCAKVSAGYPFAFGQTTKSKVNSASYTGPPLKVSKSLILPWNMSLKVDKRSYVFGNTIGRFDNASCSPMKVPRRQLSKLPEDEDDNDQFATRIKIPPGAPWWSRLIMYEGPPPYPLWRLNVLRYMASKVDYWLTLSPETRMTIKQSLIGSAFASVFMVLKDTMIWLFTSHGDPTDLELRVTLLEEALEANEGQIRLLTEQLKERNAEILILKLSQSPQTIHISVQFALCFAHLLEPSLVSCLDLAEGFGMGYWSLT